MNKTARGSIPADIKISNRQTILNIYRSGKTMTPNEVSDAVGLSRQTVSKVIDYFLKTGILIPVGKGRSTEAGGRRPNNYELSRNICFVSVNAEIKTVYFTLFNLYSEILYRAELPLSLQPEYSEFEEKVREGAEIMYSKLEPDAKIYGISVTVRGLVDSAEKSVRYSPFYTKWKRDTSMKSLLSFFPDARILALDKPVRTFARYLLERNTLSFADQRILVLFFHSGMAGATIDHGHIENGRNSIIGEFSHMLINSESSDSIADCIYPYAIQKYLEALRKDYPESTLLKETELTYQQLFEASDANDPLARKGVEHLAHNFAIMIRNINLSFDADQIILLGDYAKCDAYFLQLLKKEVSQFIYYPENYTPQIICDRTSLNEMLVLGSASNMLHEFYKDPSLYTQIL